MEQTGIAIIGAGALGRVLARRLSACGYHVEAILSRSLEKAQALAAEVGAFVASDVLDDLPASVRVVFCCVPDDAVGAVARALGPVRPDWSGTVVAHTSGALPAAALYNLGEQGAALLSFHPLQTFTATSPPAVFEGIAIALEGDAEGIVLGRRLAADLGAQSITITAEAKARYHVAASIASNFFVTLMALVDEVLGSLGMDEREAGALMRPLVEGTWRNLARQSPEEALSGPIARGDHRTVVTHLDALSAHLPHLVPVYAALATEAVRVAVRGGRLTPDDAQHILDVLYAGLKPDRDPLF